MKKYLLILNLFLLTSIIGFSQTESKTKHEQAFPVHVTLLNESISFPDLSFVNYSINPGIMVGTEYLLKKSKHHDWHLTGNLGYYYHKDWQAAVFLSSEIGYRYRLNRWSFTPRFGLGYSHGFATKPTYKYEDGAFTETRDLGSPYLLTSFAMNIGFNLSKKENSPEIYTTYMSSAEIPFSIYTGLHHFVGVGFKFYPFH